MKGEEDDGADEDVDREETDFAAVLVELIGAVDDDEAAEDEE